MDIFSIGKRQRQDSIKRPLNYPQPDIAEKTLKESHEVQLQQFRTYLKNIYAKFDFKINRCRLSCIDRESGYQDIRTCQQTCGKGVNNFKEYVDKNVREMQQLLGNCVSNATKLPNTLDQIYFCYDVYNNGFGKLKEFITEESLYYH